MERRFSARFFCNENDSVDTLQHHPSCFVVEDLTRDRVHIEAGSESGDFPDLDRQKIEEQGPVRLGLEGNQLASLVGGQLSMDPLEICGLPRQPRPVVDDLCAQFSFGVVQ